MKLWIAGVVVLVALVVWLAVREESPPEQERSASLPAAVERIEVRPDPGTRASGPRRDPPARVEVDTSWAARSYQAVAGDAPPYEEAPRRSLRPFDDSDPAMQALMGEVYARGGCARPGQRCEPAHRVLVRGGDRLARYLIDQFERSISAGYPDRLTYLEYTASTESETGFQYIRHRVRRGPELGRDDYEYAARALSKTGHDGAIDEAFRLLEEETDEMVLFYAINTLWKVPLERGELRDDALARLLELKDAGHARVRVAARTGLVKLAERFDRPELEGMESLSVK
jgi:hypothetical protein